MSFSFAVGVGATAAANPRPYPGRDRRALSTHWPDAGRRLAPAESATHRSSSSRPGLAGADLRPADGRQGRRLRGGHRHIWPCGLASNPGVSVDGALKQQSSSPGAEQQQRQPPPQGCVPRGTASRRPAGLSPTRAAVLARVSDPKPDWLRPGWVGRPTGLRGTVKRSGWIRRRCPPGSARCFLRSMHRCCGCKRPCRARGQEASR